MPDGWGVDPAGVAEAPRFPVQAHLCGGLLGATGGTALLGWLEYLWLDLDLYPGQLTFWLTLGSFVLAIVSLNPYIKTASVRDERDDLRWRGTDRPRRNG